MCTGMIVYVCEEVYEVGSMCAFTCVCERDAQCVWEQLKCEVM